MSYETYRVGTRASADDGAVMIEITASIDRVPETNDCQSRELTRVPKGCGKPAAIAAISRLGRGVPRSPASPRASAIRCYEYSVDQGIPGRGRSVIEVERQVGARGLLG